MSEVNLKSVRRIDPYIKRIITSHASVCQYLYDCESSAWSKTEMEGTFFLYERETDPLFGFLILNRISTKNLVETITPDLELMLHQPFILYKTKEGVICGLWFYEEATCQAVHSKMAELVETTKMRMRIRLNTPQEYQQQELNSKNKDDNDLAKKLNLASMKDNKGPGGRDQAKDSNSSDKLSAMLSSALAVSSKPPPNTVETKPTQSGEEPNGNVAAFFAQASVHQSAFSAQNVVPFQQQHAVNNNECNSSNNGSNMGNIGANATLFLPPQMRHMMPPPIVPKPIPPAVESAGHQRQQLQHRETQQHQRSSQERDQPSSPNMLMATLMKNPSAHSLETIEQRMHSPKLSSEAFKMQPQPGLAMPSLPTVPSQAQTAAELERAERPSRASGASPIAQQLNFMEDAELLSPMVLMGRRSIPQQVPKNTNGENDGDVTPLTKNQLVQALDHLLKTDPGFVTKLHQSYVESLNFKLHMN